MGFDENNNITTTKTKLTKHLQQNIGSTSLVALQSVQLLKTVGSKLHNDVFTHMSFGNRTDEARQQQWKVEYSSYSGRRWQEDAVLPQ